MTPFAAWLTSPAPLSLPPGLRTTALQLRSSVILGEDLPEAPRHPSSLSAVFRRVHAVFLAEEEAARRDAERAARSARSTATWAAPERRAKLSEQMQGRLRTEEGRAALARAREAARAVPKVWTEAARAAAAERARAQAATPEGRAILERARAALGRRRDDVDS